MQFCIVGLLHTPSVPKDQSDPILLLTTSLHSEDVDIAKRSMPENSSRKSAKLVGSLVILDAMPDICAAPVESSECQVRSRCVLCALYVFFFMDAEFFLALEVFFFIS